MIIQVRFRYSFFAFPLQFQAWFKNWIAVRASIQPSFSFFNTPREIRTSQNSNEILCFFPLFGFYLSPLREGDGSRDLNRRDPCHARLWPIRGGDHCSLGGTHPLLDVFKELHNERAYGSGVHVRSTRSSAHRFRRRCRPTRNVTAR